MSELRSLLGLPERSRPEKSAQAEQFSRAFRDRMQALNCRAQSVVGQAATAEVTPLESRRARLYEAYHTVSSQIDPSNPGRASPGIDRVLTAIDAVGRNTQTVAAEVAEGRQQWQQHSQAFDETLQMIAELEDAGHTKAPALRKLGEVVRGYANDRRYRESAAAHEMLRPKLDAIYAEHMQHAAAEPGSIQHPTQSTEDRQSAAQSGAKGRLQRRRELAQLRERLQSVMKILGM